MPTTLMGTAVRLSSFNERTDRIPTFPYRKAEVTQYCKDIGMPFVNVQAAGYMQNYLGWHLRLPMAFTLTDLITRIFGP